MTKNWFTWLSLDRPLYWHQYNERNPRAPSLQDVYSGTMVLQPWLLYQITPSLTMRKKIFFVESSAISYCPICGEPLAYRDSCQRIMLLEGRERRIYIIRRLKCHQCGRIHRELPDCLAPFKHYATEVISGVLDGIVTPEDDDSADYLLMISWAVIGLLLRTVIRMTNFLSPKCLIPEAGDPRPLASVQISSYTFFIRKYL